MQLVSTISIAACALATLVIADGSSGLPNTAHWHSLDNVDRTIHCEHQSDQPVIQDFDVPAGQTVNSTFPQGWIGNCFANVKGQPTVPGMLAEFRWDGWQGIHFFDVSAIVNPSDTNGVKEMWPLTSQTPLSGCKEFLCDNCYILSEDIQTKSTKENQIVVTLGTKDNGGYTDTPGNNHKRFHKKRGEVHQERTAEPHPIFPRSYVTGEAWEI